MRRRLPAFALLALAAAGCSGKESAEAGPPPEGAAPGRSVFQPCASCHFAAPPGSPAAKQPSVGPNLWGVYGRPAGEADYAYSPAMRAAGLVWDEATLDAFLANPLKFVPGSRMSYAGEPDAETRKAIIDYLKTLK